MRIKLFDSELKIMEPLWRDGTRTAKELAAELAETSGWNKNTTYTVLKKCIEKGAVVRKDPGFHCRALISRADVQKQETFALLDRMFGGSPSNLVASLLGGEKQLPPEEIDRLKKLIDQLD